MQCWICPCVSPNRVPFWHKTFSLIFFLWIVKMHAHMTATLVAFFVTWRLYLITHPCNNNWSCCKCADYPTFFESSQSRRGPEKAKGRFGFIHLNVVKSHDFLTTFILHHGSKIVLSRSTSKDVFKTTG